jgi:hypothetical protein
MSEQTKALGNVIKTLTAKEERAAIEAARSHLGRELSARYRIFPAELRIEKPRSPRTIPARAVSLLVLDYERRRTLEVLVDAESKVSGVTDQTGFQPAFLPEEVDEARKIAERDERVAKVSKARGTFASAFGPHPTEERGARLVGLRYAVVDAKRRVRLLGEAVVDLSRRTLVSFAAEQEG